MKLRFGKAGWIELDQMPLASHVVEGVRVFEPATAAAGRAAFLTNAVVATTFGKAVPSFATATERERIGADKVESAAFRDKDGAVRVVYREAVVRFEPQATPAQRKALLDKFHLEVRARNTFHRDQVIVFDPRRTYIAERMCELANELTDTPEVAFAFPNFVSEFKRMAVPTPRAQQWHLPVVKARKAWASTLGNGITVAVLDDGVDVDHPNLKGNIRRNPDPGERRDLCGRDLFVGEDVPEHFDPRPKLFQAPFDQYPGNDIHGTCCAGVAAATGARAKVYGSAPKAWLLPVKVFHADELATESRVADAIRYATRFADILSCSWRGPQSGSVQKFSHIQFRLSGARHWLKR
jgi:subtilisin family serine protease